MHLFSRFHLSCNIVHNQRLELLIEPRQVLGFEEPDLGQPPQSLGQGGGLLDRGGHPGPQRGRQGVLELVPTSLAAICSEGVAAQHDPDGQCEYDDDVAQ